MRKIVKIRIDMLCAAALGALALSSCATDTDLLKTVPVGSGTSRLAIYDFTRCVKNQWTPLGGRLREYSPGADSEAIGVRGSGDVSTVLALAQPSASGTGYTIYGDVAVASRYVAAAHTCD